MVGGGTCDRCGSALEPGAAFCTNCGVSLADRGGVIYVTCSTCGGATPPALGFCTECGAKLDAELHPARPGSEGDAGEHPRARNRRRLVVALIAAALVVVVGMTGVVYAVTTRDDGGRSKVEGTTTPSASKSKKAPDAAAVEKVRRARFRASIVGCPRAASSDAVAVGERRVLVPSSVVQGASRVLLTGAEQPEQARLLGVDDVHKVAVLEVPARAGGLGVSIAADDPAPGTPVVVVGATRGDDVPVTVANGPDGAELDTESKLPLGAVVAGRDGNAVGIVGPEGELVGARALAAAVKTHEHGTAVQLPTCHQPVGPDDMEALVARRPNVSGDQEAVVDRLVSYYSAINRQQLDTAYRMRVERDDHDSFVDGFRTTYDLGLTLGVPKVEGDRATVDVTFTSTQNADHAPGDSGQTCTRWRMTHVMERRDGSWLVGASTGATYHPCK